jgi:hypothetical protein
MAAAWKWVRWFLVALGVIIVLLVVLDLSGPLLAHFFPHGTYVR